MIDEISMDCKRQDVRLIANRHEVHESERAGEWTR